MEDALGEVLCSVIPIRHNKNQRQPGRRPRIHLQPSAVHTQPQTLYSRRKNTAVHTHLRLYETAGRHWKTSCRDLLKSDWISDVRAPRYFFCFFVKQCFSRITALSSTASLRGSLSLLLSLSSSSLLLFCHRGVFYLRSSSRAPLANSKTSSATLLALMDPQKHKINTACISSRKILLLSILLYNGFHY